MALSQVSNFKSALNYIYLRVCVWGGGGGGGVTPKIISDTD